MNGTRITNTTLANGSTLSHVDLSHQYGCPASLTTVRFAVRGAMIVARRFSRADMPSTGAIELYTNEPSNPYAAHIEGQEIPAYPRGFATEDYLRNVRTENMGAVDRMATELVARAMYTHAVANTAIPESVALRYAQIELS